MDRPYSRLLVLCVFATFIISGCATHYAPNILADPYGFFSGLWHGSIATITISVNLLSWFASLLGFDIFSDIKIIGRPNTGFMYHFGFAVGFFWLGLLR
jgi:hypothetical protein